MSPARAMGMALLAGIAGCSGETLLAVDVRTDLAPGVDFASARIDLVLTSDESGRSSRSAERIATAGETAWRTGQRIAELAMDRAGEWRVNGQLLDAGGAPVATASVRVLVRDGETTTTTLVFSPDCVDCVPDGGPMDAGPPDAGTPDAGPIGSTVEGDVVFVNAPSSTTSVLLVAEADYVQNAATGVAPPGLRGTVTEKDGHFVITGVAPGSYWVLPAFENDGLIADPDTSIGGSGFRLVVVPADTRLVVAESFKVTGALELLRPGAGAIEVVPPGPITFEWGDDSSEDRYVLRVYDDAGAVAYEVELPGSSGAATVTHTWAAPSLAEGSPYQVRIWSARSGGTLISGTEDLRGVFVVGGGT